MSLDIKAVRAQFPSLNRPTIFLDNPGGTQIAQKSLDRIQSYLLECNANHGGAFPTSQASDAILESAHEAMADFLHAARPEEIVFGLNMTTLTFGLSRALALTLKPRDSLVVTRLDHDANISPWLRIAEDRGCKIRWVDFDVEDCTLDLEDLQKALDERPRLVAVGYASNAVGTINPVREIVEMAHAAGALVFIDAVQYAPHGSIDVQDLDCDFLACSAYKLFGPHIGILYGKYEHLDSLRAYKVRPAPAGPPGKFETGTQSHEGIAGVLGAVEYFEWLGNSSLDLPAPSRRAALVRAAREVQAYEHQLNRALLGTLQAVPGLRLYGISDPDQMSTRVPTFSFCLAGLSPRDVAERLGKAGINVWDGNYYAPAVTERLGLEGSGGMVRVGATHYNTLEEILRLGEELQKLVK
ncbi:MAG TPA: cysteine desulfurase-like protein [Anaerolineaceae bacterium]|nr:cysteine desulfurase-like protein [Anaerolineaceae bacterium]